MNTKTFLKVVIPAGVIFLLIVGYTQYRSGQLKPRATSTLATPFQPEAQMMTQSKQVAPEHAAEEANAVAAAAAEKKSPAVATAAYRYSSTTCASSTTTPYLCFAGYYRGLVRTYSIDTAVADIKKRFNENPVIVSLCHPFMHVIGQEASHKYASVSEAYLHGDNFCWSGYYHGIMEGVIADIGEKNLPTKMNAICADIPGKANYNFDYYNCVHGLGHGVMELLGDEVFDSLKMCDNLSGDWEQQSCYSGVFMENIIASDNYGQPTGDWKYLKPASPLYPCDAVADRYKGQCYLGQTSYALEKFNYEFAKVVPLCVGVEQPYRNICFQSIGRDAANQALHDAVRTKNTCALATDANDFTNCVIGAVKEFVSYYHATAQALNFCAILDDTNKTICSNTGTDYFKVF